MFNQLLTACKQSVLAKTRW